MGAELRDARVYEAIEKGRLRRLDPNLMRAKGEANGPLKVHGV